VIYRPTSACWRRRLAGARGAAATALARERRTSHRTHELDESGVLRGDVQEIRTGDAAARQRFALRTSTVDTDRIKPVELMVANSLATFRLTKATIANLQDTSKPFEWHYSLEADKYAKLSGRPVAGAGRASWAAVEQPA